MTAPAIETTWTEQDSINLTVRLVADDGHRMRLTGAERVAAIRRMTELGLTVEQIADRLRISVPAAENAAKRAGIRRPKTPNDWIYDLAQPGYRETKARYRARRRQEVAA